MLFKKKKSSFVLFLTLMTWVLPLAAQKSKTIASTGDKFTIRAEFKQKQKGVAYLASYYVDDKKYVIDSGEVKNNAVNFKVRKEAPGGIYLIIFPSKDRFIDILVDQKTDFTVVIDTTNLPSTIAFTNSPKNTNFFNYQTLMNDLQKEFQIVMKDTTQKEKIVAFQKMAEEKIDNMKKKIVRDFPNSLITKIFLLSDFPELPDSVINSSQLDQYLYTKKHFWDGISFNDKQLLHTPLLKSKIDQYFDKLLSTHPDTLYKEADLILSQVDKNDSVLYSFYLNNMLIRFGNSNLMGQDKVFVKIFEKYVLDKKPIWMSESAYSKMHRSYYMLIGNIIGELAQEIKLLDTNDRAFNLYGVNSEFTVLCFWDPGCSHCQQTVPIVDSFVTAKWKNKDVKVVGIYVDGGVDNWKKFIKDKNFNMWLHGYQTREMVNDDYKNNRPSMQQSYNLASTPVLYLLDKDKRIIAKNIDIYAIDKIIEFKKKNPKAEL